MSRNGFVLAQGIQKRSECQQGQQARTAWHTADVGISLFILSYNFSHTIQTVIFFRQ